MNIIKTTCNNGFYLLELAQLNLQCSFGGKQTNIKKVNFINNTP